MPKILDWSAFKDTVLKILDERVSLLLGNKSGMDSLSLTVSARDVMTATGVRPKVMFSPTAMAKLIYMVMTCNTEIAVQGFVSRNDMEFTVEDVFMYPQRVTGANVNMADEYADFLVNISNEDLPHLRFQMHSHVKFGVTPSGVDTDTYKALMHDVEDYYIFMIMNKELQIHIALHDIQTNLIYENADIDVLFVDEYGNDIASWYRIDYRDNITVHVYSNDKAGTTASKVIILDDPDCPYRASYEVGYKYDSETRLYINADKIPAWNIKMEAAKRADETKKKNDKKPDKQNQRGTADVVPINPTAKQTGGVVPQHFGSTLRK